MDRKRQLEEQVVQLSRQVDEMRVRLAALEGGSGDRASATTPRSRRDLLKLGGAAALGVAGAVGAAALGTVPAQAADGANLVIGNNNSTTNKAESPTILVDDNATNGFTGFPGGTSPLSGALRVHGGSDAPGGGNPTLASGVDAWASGATSYGVFGITDVGVGVTGESDQGIGLYARRSGRIRQDARPAGVPNYTANEFEQVRDANSSLWLSGPPALAWRQASSFQVFPGPRRVYGVGTVLAPGQSVTGIDATKKLDGTPSGVPAGATAAYCAISSYQTGVISLYPDGTIDNGIGAWASQGTAGNGVNQGYNFVPLSAAGKFSFTNYFTSKAMYFDVWGFLFN
ncbi:MAG: hypothetical protein E6I85_00420 [Chloroflexi bacterium]|nr:MAG: hypothetical protein E6I85_00420 [Chloroflexota bacterium]